ncbi:hypothetical protein C8E95_2536 [Pseudonocardia autotrophica]|uniref:Uncharacterized protein n=2 Tax=Pseudonocardia TaxID=1847 RepID=A0A1Y2N7X4_PSEAH|nr:hypothetical protein BG845_00513 [Pseudonocardia autotrophica]TDN73439.1 hypothetical protein C8E95_2536 [Pseudonocardia autotrophica]
MHEYSTETLLAIDVRADGQVHVAPGIAAFDGRHCNLLVAVARAVEAVVAEHTAVLPARATA